MWRNLFRHLGSRFRSVYPNQPTSTNCDDCSSTSSNCTDRSVVPTYPFTNTRTDSKGSESKKKNCRNKKTCYNRPTLVDAGVLGWGTAALYGLQQYISLLLGERTEPDDIKPKYSCTASCILSRYVFSTARSPLQNQSLVLSVLPDSAKSTTQLQYEQATPLESYELNSFLSSNSESSAKSSTAEHDILLEKKDAHNAVTAAAHELQAVTNLCVATIQNSVGIQLSQKDQPTEALPYFLAGCELGYSKACFNAAVCYEMGLGTEKDLTKARELYEAAIGKGHVAAMYNLGVFYKEGIGNVPKDENRSLSLFEEAAVAGLKEAQSAMGLHYIESNELHKAIPFLEAASAQKDPQGEFYLGVCYENGWGIEENMAKAADLYAKAAQKGHLDAKYNLAVFYELGLGGLPQQLDTALEMYKIVAASGHDEAAERASYLQEQKQIECRYHDAELLADPESIGLHPSASAPELHVHNPNNKFSSTQLVKSSSMNSLENVFNAFSNNEDSKENRLGLFHDRWPYQNEMGQTNSLEVPWVGV